MPVVGLQGCIVVEQLCKFLDLILFALALVRLDAQGSLKLRGPRHSGSACSARCLANATPQANQCNVPVPLQASWAPGVTASGSPGMQQSPQRVLHEWLTRANCLPLTIDAEMPKICAVVKDPFSDGCMEVCNMPADSGSISFRRQHCITCTTAQSCCSQHSVKDLKILKLSNVMYRDRLAQNREVAVGGRAI